MHIYVVFFLLLYYVYYSRFDLCLPPQKWMFEEVFMCVTCARKVI